MEKKDVLSLKNDTSISELIKIVRNGGINTDIECINKYADIIGCKSMEQLKEGAYEDKSTFFFLLRYVWNMQDILSFYNNYCNERIRELEEGYQKMLDLEAQNNMNLESITNLNTIIQNKNDKERDLISNNIKLGNKIAGLETELMRLKAKLFDLQNS